MKTPVNKSNIIQIFLLAVVTLLALNIILEKYYPPAYSFNQKELSATKIEHRFLTSLENYNLDSAWIIKKNISSDNEDSLKYNYKVEVPVDLPVTLLLREIQSQFDTNEVNISSIEFKSDNSTRLQISSGGYLKLKAYFKYKSSIFRNTDSIGFALTGIEGLNGDDIKKLLFLPEHFAGILTPSRHSEDLLKTMTENQKEAAVLLNDDISELEFRLKTGYSEKRIRNSILSVIRKFHDASFFIIDQNSSIYHSDHFKMIENEFLKRHLILVTENNFVEMGNASKEEVITAIRSEKKRKTIYMISAEGFLELPTLLADLRKTGYKFVNPLQLIKR